MADGAMQQLKQAVYAANKELVRAGLVVLTWGNASGVDRERGIVAIKPSGVAYDALRAEDIVLVSLETGQPLPGETCGPRRTRRHTFAFTSAFRASAASPTPIRATRRAGRRLAGKSPATGRPTPTPSTALSPCAVH